MFHSSCHPCLHGSQTPRERCSAPWLKPNSTLFTYFLSEQWQDWGTRRKVLKESDISLLSPTYINLVSRAAHPTGHLSTVLQHRREMHAQEHQCHQVLFILPAPIFFAKYLWGNPPSCTVFLQTHLLVASESSLTWAFFFLFPMLLLIHNLSWWQIINFAHLRAQWCRNQSSYKHFAKSCSIRYQTLFLAKNIWASQCSWQPRFLASSSHFFPLFSSSVSLFFFLFFLLKCPKNCLPPQRPNVVHFFSSPPL